MEIRLLRRPPLIGEFRTIATLPILSNESAMLLDRILYHWKNNGKDILD